MNSFSQTILFKKPVYIIGSFSLVGPKEGVGPFKNYFDLILTNDLFEEETYEKAECKMLEHSICNSILNSKLENKDIDLLMCGDLLNQTISSNFAARQFDMPFIGLYGACSTMSESLALASCLIDGGFFTNIACATVSHFSSAERQYRFPLELGNQRPPTSQWTVTGSAATVLSKNGTGAAITSATFGKVIDFGIKDVNNMGAAMAPAAADTLKAHLTALNLTPNDYDLIVTGDLGKLGSEVFIDLLEHDGIKLKNNYCDCGQMIFSRHQHTFMGGSGAGCSAVILNSFLIKKLKEKELNKILFIATGALLSTTSSLQGESIPAIAHAVVIENIKIDKIDTGNAKTDKSTTKTDTNTANSDTNTAKTDKSHIEKTNKNTAKTKK